MPPCFAGSNRPLEMVVYDPAAASKRARQGETSTPSPSANPVARALRAVSAPPPFGNFAPISAIPPRLPPLPTARSPPLAADAGREEPPCLRKHFLAELGLRADLPVHFIAEKLVTSTDLDGHQNRFRIPSDGVERRLRAILTPRELHDANLLHAPPPMPRKRPRHEQLAADAAAEGEQRPPAGKKAKKPKRKGKVHGGLRMKLVDLAAGARELRMSRWESSRGTIVKGEGYLDFVRRCSFKERDAVEIWAFVQRRVRLFGSVLCDDSLLHVLVVKKDKQARCNCLVLPHERTLPVPAPAAVELNPSSGS
ncbi:hypothetical protein PVAP13_5NG429800 [Panicum virgatum]|uniref:Uncharacterized protein n=1 Tax=Panicum virgatum TaxID=38727 RepID=A0A8T0RWF2_PANVG|nr:hypothetical protein PVAP13_5NG429800 [Panicum virgatum]